MATPEKALLDLIYLSRGRPSFFKSLPELELPATFSSVRAKKMIEKITSIRLRTLVSTRLDVIIKK